MFKNLMPFTIELIIGSTSDIPEALRNTYEGQIAWAIIFSILLLIVSLPRQLNALRFTSFVSFFISVFVVFSIIGLSFIDLELEEQSSDFIDRWNFALYESDITIAGIFNSLPLIIFAYMYQPNIPAIYQEMKEKSMFKMKKVLAFGTAIASFSYIFTGVFGYVTFV